MKTSIQSNSRKLNDAWPRKCLAMLAGIGMLALATTLFITPAHAGPNGQQSENTQVAGLDQLAADFHGALSYGGNITKMMSLWADDSSITLNGVAHVGKPAVQTFFQTGGYFIHNWVSLAPEYKTQITIHGDTAEIITQCIAVDLDVSPMVVRGVIQVDATCEKINGTWQFTSMNNSTPAPL